LFLLPIQDSYAAVDEHLIRYLGLDSIPERTRQSVLNDVKSDYSSTPHGRDFYKVLSDGTQANWDVLMLTGLSGLALGNASDYYSKMTNGAVKCTKDDVLLAAVKLNTLIKEEPKNKDIKLEEQVVTSSVVMRFIEYIQTDFIFPHIKNLN